MMKWILRLTALAIAALVLFVAPLAAQNWPDRIVRIVVPYPAGGANDVLARILAPHLSEALGQQFIVENRASAGGNTGADSVAKAAPDGHTLLMTAPGPLVINPTLYGRLPFDPTKDFAPIALIASVPIVLAVHPGVAANDLPELIALAKKEPGKLSFGTAGIGTTHHLAGELLKRMVQIDIVHVPYRGNAPAMNDLLGGHLPMVFDNMPSVLPQITAGKIRGIAVLGDRRAASLPGLRTVAEQGVAGFEASSWFGLVAPARTPPAVLKRLTEEFTTALAKPDVVVRFRELGAEPSNATGEILAAFLRAETAKWAGVIRASGAKAE